MTDAYAREYESFFSGSIRDGRRSKLKGVLMVAAKRERRRGNERTAPIIENCAVFEKILFFFCRSRIKFNVKTRQRKSIILQFTDYNISIKRTRFVTTVLEANSTPGQQLTSNVVNYQLLKHDL